MSPPRVILLGDRSREDVAAVLDEVREAIAPYVTVTGEFEATDGPLPGVAVDMAVAVGGDGTLISQARRLVGMDVPLVGVNVGRLGFLAEFDAESLREHASVVFGPSPPIQQRMILRASVIGEGGRVRSDGVAINDCVLTSGPPFRMIRLQLSVDGAEGPTLSGDGVIIATPVGSTAYNVSAGGPIVHPAVEAMVITPLAAHSLAFRPIVLCAESDLVITVVEANDGTSIIHDGQVSTLIRAGDRVSIRRHERRARFVTHPATTYWHILLDKLRWAAPPNYRAVGAQER